MQIAEMDELLERVKAALPFGMVLLVNTDVGFYDSVREAVDAVAIADAEEEARDVA